MIPVALVFLLIIWPGVASWRFARRVLRDWRAHSQRPRPLPPARLLIERHQRWLRRYGDVIGVERN